MMIHYWIKTFIWEEDIKILGYAVALPHHERDNYIKLLKISLKKKLKI